MNNDNPETKQERRERKRQRKKGQIPQHGRSLARIYKDAILKRLGRKPKDQP